MFLKRKMVKSSLVCSSYQSETPRSKGKSGITVLLGSKIKVTRNNDNDDKQMINK